MRYGGYMSEPKKHTPRRVIIIRIICAVLAFLMVGSIVYSAIALLLL